MVQKQSTVGIIGYGFVGRATAELRTISKINIYDPFLKDYFSQQHYKDAYNSHFVICCVPTPEGKDGNVDLKTLNESVQRWSTFGMENIFIIKSTIPAGTVDRLCKKYNTKNIIHNPEFLTERTHIEDFNNPTDVVIGGDKEICEKLANLYKKFYNNIDNSKEYIDINICTAMEAELLKTVRNSFYATKVSFMNEVYLFARKLGIDYNSFEKVLTNDGKHPWWGPQHTKVPGHDGKLGWGGKCFPKDTSGLYQLAKDKGVNLSILKAAIKRNKKFRDKDDKK